jgi:hypothetical protein
MSFIRTCIGFALFAWLALTKLSLYAGMRAFYRLAQTGNAYARALLSGPLATLASDFAFSQANADTARLSTRAIEQYSDDSLLGYGDAEWSKGGSTLAEQQRGLILPLIEKALDVPKTVIEVGTGNGDVIAYLAERFPSSRFIGIDFSVKTAAAKHQRPNLSFVAGYALDVLDGIAADILFASSTFVVFPPKEFAAYLAKAPREIILSEPTWGGFEQRNDSAAISHHMEGACWFHNWAGYLRAAGYEIVSFDCMPYRHPASSRPDLTVTLIHSRKPHAATEIASAVAAIAGSRN